MRKKKPVPRQKNRAESEARLLDAAKKVFAEKGFSAATTRAIAQKSGINLALITRYFKKKQGLFVAVIERDISQHRACEMDYPSGINLTEECLGYIESRFKSHTEDVEYFRMVIGQFVTDRKIFKRIQDKLMVEPEAEVFHQRVVPHLNKAGIKDANEIRRFVERIGTNVISTILFDVIMRGTAVKPALEDLKHFVHTYCTGIESRATENQRP